MAEGAFEYFTTNTLSRDLFDLCAGTRLGNGIGRHVHVFQPDPTLVIKFETASQSFQNIAEWDIWDQVKDSNFARWFAPCVSISSAGTVLLQKRAEPAPKHMFPDKVPAFFADLKRPNWGLIDGKLVCVDYGHHAFFQQGMTKRMKKAEWWD